MRWYVEVSSIDGAVASDKYCVEAKQWQAALQEARRIRGESGPLSKFSIELMDDGYRAVDPAAQIRYVVNKAPPASVLSEKGSLRPPTTGTPPRRASAGPPAPSVAPPKDAAVPKDIAPPPDAPVPKDIAAMADAAPPAGEAAAQNPTASPETAPPAQQDAAPAPKNVAAPQTATPLQDAGNARIGSRAGTTASRAPEKPSRLVKPRAQPAPVATAPVAAAPVAAAPAAEAAPAADTPSGVGPIRPMAVHVVGETPLEKSAAGSLTSAAPIAAAPAAPIAAQAFAAPIAAQPSASPAQSPRPNADAGLATVEAAGAARQVATATAPPRPATNAPKRAPRPGTGNGAALAGEPIPPTEPMPAPPVSQSPKAAHVAIVVPDDQVPPPPQPPRPSAPPMSDTQPTAAIPPASPVIGVLHGVAGAMSNDLASARPTQPSIESVKAPDFTLVRKREEEPRPDAPITYREYAYAVDPGTDRKAAEVLLWQRFRELSQQIAGRPKGKFIQLAVFDHVFEKRPLRAPIASLAWKDWRGDPVVQFSADVVPEIKPAPSYPPPAATAPAADVVQPALVQPAPAATADEPAPVSQSVSIELGPEVDLDSTDIRSERPNLASSAPVAAAAAPVPDPTTLPAPTAQASAQPASGGFVAAPAAPGPAPAEPKPAQRSDPVIRRRRLGEDLISQLFESMHELHFMRDIVSGAEFVLGVLNDTLPCELTLIHVFDINTGQFVLVRANGPGSDKLVLFRTSGQDALFSQAMRRLHAVRVDDAGSDERFTGGRWGVIGLKPRQALCGGVKQGGRYLGAIELINPGGDETFYESEANALDYICEQFAEFLTNRPIVLDAEVVLSKG